MATLPYSCSATPLSAAGVQAALATLGINEATLWTLMAVETAGFGYWNDQRPQILYERHIFSRLTHGQFDASHPDISNPTSGGYGPSGSNQYVRLGAAAALNQDAALQAASWGLGQVLGENFSNGQFADSATMVEAMCASEDAQLALMVGFIMSKRLAPALQNQQWAAYAVVYNGSDYAKNHYDTKLAQSYSAYSNGALPDLNVRAAQIYLTYLGYAPQGVDGKTGVHTLTALHNFQAGKGLPLTTGIDEDTVAALAAAMPAASNLLLG